MFARAAISILPQQADNHTKHAFCTQGNASACAQRIIARRIDRVIIATRFLCKELPKGGLALQLFTRFLLSISNDLPLSNPCAFCEAAKYEPIERNAQHSALWNLVLRSLHCTKGARARQAKRQALHGHISALSTGTRFFVPVVGAWKLARSVRGLPQSNSKKIM